MPQGQPDPGGSSDRQPRDSAVLLGLWCWSWGRRGGGTAGRPRLRSLWSRCPVLGAVGGRRRHCSSGLTRLGPRPFPAASRLTASEVQPVSLARAWHWDLWAKSDRRPLGPASSVTCIGPLTSRPLLCTLGPLFLGALGAAGGWMCPVEDAGPWPQGCLPTGPSWASFP